MRLGSHIGNCGTLPRSLGHSDPHPNIFCPMKKAKGTAKVPHGWCVHTSPQNKTPVRSVRALIGQPWFASPHSEKVPKRNNICHDGGVKP